MAYRKINVDDRVFKYSIGATHVKILGIGIFSKGDLDVVTPEDIAQVIRAFTRTLPRYIAASSHLGS